MENFKNRSSTHPIGLVRFRLGTREDKLAFWINVYKVAAIKTILDHYPVDSIRSRKIHWLGLPWDRKIIRVGGN